MDRLNFKKVADTALARIDDVLAKWLPGGRYQGKEYVVLNPTRDDQKPGSFTINRDKGVWLEAATGDRGGDLISLIAYLERANQVEGCKRLGHYLGLTDKEMTEGQGKAGKAHTAPPVKPGKGWRPIFPAPDHALANCPRRHPSLGDPSRCWEYRDGAGKLLFKVLRFDVVKGEGRHKEYRPLCFGRDGSGKTGWSWKQPPGDRPLYGLDHLATTAATVPVLLCEGEKAADAARVLFPDAVAMTWPSGSKAITKTDFSPLAGRAVWYWPDHDQAGKDSVSELAKALSRVGVASFALVDLALLDKYTPTNNGGAATLSPGPGDGGAWPEKADAADAAALGWTVDHLALLQDKGLLAPYPLKGAAKTAAAPSAPPTGAPDKPQDRFKTTDLGLFAFDPKREAWRRVGGRLDVLARSRNADGRSWGLLVAFDDFDGQRKEWNIPSALFATEGGAEVVRGLLDRGYSLSPYRDARNQLREYLGSCDTRERVRLVERMGWHGAAFLLPDKVLGTPLEPLHYYSDAPPLCKMGQAGTVEQWREHVGACCVGNSLMTFAVSAAFAGPMLHIRGSETCGFHFVGDSSLGKSTLLKVAASVYGHPDHYPRTWRATDNALEATAAAHSDCLLVLDEIGQIEPRIVGETVYMLGNGEGKSRATETGGARGTSHRWRVVFLSSGEKTLLDHMAEAHKKPQAGMEIRLLTIPANPHTCGTDQKRLGIYQDAKGMAGGADLSAHLLHQARQFHGTPIVQFLQALTAKPEARDIAKHITATVERFKAAHLARDASGQAHRAADKFALVAAAGEYATMLGITGWPYGWATQAAGECFRAWLGFRGGAGSLEDTQALAHVRLMLTKYGESRFTRWEGDGARVDEHTPRTMDRWGFRKTEEERDSMDGDTTESVFYLPPDGFKDMAKGLDAKRVARVLFEAGALETDNEKGVTRYTKKVRLPGSGKRPVGCYVIRLPVLLAGAGGDDDRPPPAPDSWADEVAGF